MKLICLPNGDKKIKVPKGTNVDDIYLKPIFYWKKAKFSIFFIIKQKIKFYLKNIYILAMSMNKKVDGPKYVSIY